MKSSSQAKAALAFCIGLGIAMIGLDDDTGMPRYAGGELHLVSGVGFLVAIAGLLTVSGIFALVETLGRDSFMSASSAAVSGR